MTPSGLPWTRDERAHTLHNVRLCVGPSSRRDRDRPGATGARLTVAVVCGAPWTRWERACERTTDVQRANERGVHPPRDWPRSIRHRTLSTPCRQRAKVARTLNLVESNGVTRYLEGQHRRCAGPRLVGAQALRILDLWPPGGEGENENGHEGGREPARIFQK